MINNVSILLSSRFINVFISTISEVVCSLNIKNIQQETLKHSINTNISSELSESTN